MIGAGHGARLLDLSASPSRGPPLALAFVGFGSSIAVVFVAVWERVFPVAVKTPAPVARRVSMASEDADVDELLRLIATAEDKLATQHTSTKVVLITDMKSFSR